MHNGGIVWCYLELEERKQRKVILFFGNVGGPENNQKTGHPRLETKIFPSIIYGQVSTSTVVIIDEDDGCGTDASPSPVARVISQLACRNAFETHLPRPDATEDGILRHRQRATLTDKVNAPPRKKSRFRFQASGVAVTSASTATEELRPRRRAGNGERGGVRCSSFDWCLIVACPPHPTV